MQIQRLLHGSPCEGIPEWLKNATACCLCPASGKLVPVSKRCKPDTSCTDAARYPLPGARRRGAHFHTGDISALLMPTAEASSLLACRPHRRSMRTPDGALVHCACDCRRAVRSNVTTAALLEGGLGSSCQGWSHAPPPGWRRGLLGMQAGGFPGMMDGLCPKALRAILPLTTSSARSCCLSFGSLAVLAPEVGSWQAARDSSTAAARSREAAVRSSLLWQDSRRVAARARLGTLPSPPACREGLPGASVILVGRA